MSVFAWIVLGAGAGWLASIFTGKNARMGLVANVVVGILGGFVGGFLMNLAVGKGITGFNAWSLLVATLGASLLLWLIQKVRK